ncbi:hypothetical protein MRB53_030959 [Persea americana]|uniref:Uncharacterized protein n=1 Tax=Persea americana TaxID=3435 RepID=A0ACC2KN97_PERAE|nr:hypothetical protein MRB53_030959 [Persea americana]
MALRRVFGFTDGELMRADCKPCSTLMKHTATIFTVGGGIGFWVLCRLHYGTRMTLPRTLRWAACGAVSGSNFEFLQSVIFRCMLGFFFATHHLHQGKPKCALQPRIGDWHRHLSSPRTTLPHLGGQLWQALGQEITVKTGSLDCNLSRR